MLRAAAIKQEPFSVYHNRRQTPWSDHTVVGRRSNAAQWVQPGTVRVYAHYHVTATPRLNGFPLSFKNWHIARAGPSDFTLLHRCKRRQYSMFCGKCNDHIASILIYRRKLYKVFLLLEKLESEFVAGIFWCYKTMKFCNKTTSVKLKKKCILFLGSELWKSDTLKGRPATELKGTNTFLLTQIDKQWI